MTNQIEDQLRRAVTTIRALKQELEVAKAVRPSTQAHTPVAIIGVGLRLPGGAAGGVMDLDGFWRLLVTGTDAIIEVPKDRWDIDQWYDPDPDATGRMNSRWGGFLSGIDRFDAPFFDLSAREAASMDPQQRLLLEVAWEALETAAINPDRLRGSATGVYVGINAAEYHDMAMANPDAIDAHALSGGVASVAAGRISYLLGLQGPALAVDTACSSSLAAVHLALRAIRAGDCDAALAGGVYTVLRPNLSVALSKLHMMAPDGRCKSFDAAADGFVQGEGAALILLKRLDAALADGDPIVAVIRGGAMNQDGRTGSLTAPSRQAQTDVIRAALADAGVAADDIGFVETHGTGTALGDPIEIHALADALGRDRQRPLWLGALKSNIGHLGPAAGIAGLIKAALVLRHGQVPPNLHFRNWNPNIDLEGFPARLPKTLTPLETRQAGVSSFGFSGTNVHLVLEAPPARPMATERPDPWVVAVSARTSDALAQALDRLARHLDGLNPDDLPSVSRASLIGRRAHGHRVAVLANSPAQAAAALRQARTHSIPSRPRLGVVAPGGALPADIPLSRWGVRPVAVVSDAADLAGFDCTHVLTLPWHRGEAALLADLFLAGIDLDWNRALPPGPRAVLPTYPFQRRSHWRADAGPRPGPNPVPPGDRQDSPSAEAAFCLTLDLARLPWLGDHRVDGNVLVPGAMQIACLTGAWRETGGTGPCRIKGLTFVHPLALPETGSVSITTLITPDGVASLSSRGDAGWVRHADARLEPAPPWSAPLDLPDWQVTCTDPVSPADWREELAGMGIWIGPAFHGIQALWRGEATALARIVPPPCLAGNGPGQWHPAVLDACFQVAGGALPAAARGTALLPIGIDSLTLAPGLDPAPPLWAVARCTSTGPVYSTDIQVCTDDGTILLSLTGLHVRPLRNSPGIPLHNVAWRPAPPAPPPDPRPWAVLGGEVPGCIAWPTDRPVAGLIDLSLWDATGDAISIALAGLERIRVLPDLSSYALVIRADRTEQAGLSGLIATLALERPDIAPRLISLSRLSDLPAALAVGENVGVAAGAVLVPRLVPVPPLPPARAHLRGTVLITGGLGGIGRAVAAWAADRGAHDLVLVGRDTSQAPDFLSTLKVPARAVVCDMADPAAVASLVAGLPDLRSVIHLAGVQAPGLLADITPERFAEAMAAKVGGAWALHHATAGRDLDHFILFSSLAGILGAAGQGGYAAGNAALDALARHRANRDLPALSIAWGRFAGDGMAGSLDPVALARVDALGLRAMPMAAALDMLDRVIASGIVHIVAADVDWRRFAARHPSGRTPTLLSELVPAAAMIDAPPDGGLLDRLIDAAALILGAADRAEIDPDLALVRLGLDSLMAVELRNRVQVLIGTAPGIALLLGGASLRDVAAAMAPAVAEPAEEWEELTL